MILATAALVACLSQNAYFDARSDGAAGMVAVTWVAINRATSGDPRWPRDLCAAVHQRVWAPPVVTVTVASKGHWVCQFSWYCDGKSDVVPHDQIGMASKNLSAWVLDGKIPDPTHGATCYHRVDVYPSWAKKLRPTAVIGVHIFYRC